MPVMKRAKNYQAGGSVRRDDPPRSFRRNVDEDIQRAERRVRELEAEGRGNSRNRYLFGGAETHRGVLGQGRNRSDLEQTEERLRRAREELEAARTYRRQYPDEPPAGTARRPNLTYKKGGVVRAKAKKK
jgi:hypothetical protein